MKKRVSGNFVVVKNNHGVSIIMVLGALAFFSVVAMVFSQKLIDVRKTDLTTKTILSYDDLTSGIMDYVVHSVKSSWCIGDQWTHNTECLPLKDSGSIRRLLLSNEALRTLGETYLMKRTDGKLADTDIAEYPSCATGDALSQVPASGSALINWLEEWNKCVGIGPGRNQLVVTGTIKFDEIQLPHPVALLWSIDSIRFKTLKLDRVEITVSIASPVDVPHYGREVNLKIKTQIISKDAEGDDVSPAPTFVSFLAATPVELNQYGLVLAGDLHLDKESYSGSEKGGYIKTEVLANIASTSVGVNFESPVFVNNRIFLPAKTENLAEQTGANVRFADKVFLGFDRNANANCEALNTGENGAAAYAECICSSNSDSVTGAICQGANFANQNIAAKTHPKATVFNYHVDLLTYDKGLDYIAGPNLSGLSDGDAELGNGMQMCIDSKSSSYNLRYTRNNQISVIQMNPQDNGHYYLVWKDSVGSNFTLQKTNRFQTPKSDRPRGAAASCYTNYQVEDRLIRPQTYGVISSVRSYEDDGNTITEVPIFEITDLSGNAIGTNNFQVNNLITAPMDLFSSQGEALGYCPRNRNVNQITAIENDFKEKTAVVANIEYLLEVKLPSLVETKLNTYKTDMTTEDSLDTLLIRHKGEATRGLANDIQRIEDRLIQIFKLDPESDSNPQCGIQAATIDAESLVYCGKALMGVNTKLTSTGLSSRVKNEILFFVNEFKNFLAFRVGSAGAGTTYGDVNENRPDGSMYKQNKKSIRYQIGKVLEAILNETVDGHDVSAVTAALNTLNDQINAQQDVVNGFQNQLNTLNAQMANLQSDLTTAQNIACTMVDDQLVCVPSTSDSDGDGVLDADICNMTQRQDCSARDAAVNLAQSAIQAKEQEIQSKTQQLADAQSALNILNSAKNKVVVLQNRINKLNEVQTYLVLLKGDLEDIIDKDISLKEPADKLTFNVDDEEKEIFHPSVLQLDVNLPRQDNMFLVNFDFLLNGFDPSFIYTKTSSDPCSDEGADSSVVRAKVNEKCIEFKSTRATEQVSLDGGVSFKQKFSGAYKNSFHVHLEPGNADVAKRHVYDPEIRVKENSDDETAFDKLKDYARNKHSGYLDLACKVVDAYSGVVSDSDATEAMEFKSNNRLSEPALWKTNFATQTNHSWYFAPIDPFKGFADSVEASYALDGNGENLTIDQSTIPDEIPSNFQPSDAFEVHSIMSTCKFTANVKIYTGFIVCRNLVIESRTTPLYIYGTVIAGKLSIDSNAVNAGVFFRSIYHPEAKRLLTRRQDCIEAIDNNPVWFNPPTNSSASVLANFEKLDQCTMGQYRAKAQPLTWSRVDPDCGLLKKFDVTGSTGETFSYKMMCKDYVDNYFIVEKSRNRVF
jgi:hypothetical protein